MTTQAPYVTICNHYHCTTTQANALTLEVLKHGWAPDPVPWHSHTVDSGGLLGGGACPQALLSTAGSSGILGKLKT